MADNLYNPANDTPSPPLGILVSGHFNESYGYHVRRTKGTRDWLITYTLSGEGIFQFGYDVVSSRNGDVVILPPGTPHNYGTAKEEKWEFVWAHFIPRSEWFSWFQMQKSEEGFYHLHIEDSVVRKRIHNAFIRLINDSQSLSAFHDELALNSLEEVLLLSAQKHSNATSNKLDLRVGEVIHILSHNLSDSHTVKDLAQKVSLSPSRLAHLFKEQVGSSIIETLLKIRLRQAARLLEFTSRQITEIAHDVGFQSPYYFTKQFTTHYGINPTAYRKEIQEGKKG
jgi:AraC family transcriptional regulator of arabinose operon